MVESEVRNLLVDISIVSHGQSHLVNDLLLDLHPMSSEIGNIFLVKNIPEVDPPAAIGFNNLTIIENEDVKGFGANQNHVAAISSADILIIINPDIRLEIMSIGQICLAFGQNDIDVLAPVVRAPSGSLEDSVRAFPSAIGLFKKLLGLGDGGIQEIPNQGVNFIEWAAGMFLAIRLDRFKKLNGFDENFFLYYEDVDLCARVWSSGGKVACLSSQLVLHDAQRTSHRNLKYMVWHLKSLARYFWKYGLAGPKILKKSWLSSSES